MMRDREELLSASPDEGGEPPEEVQSLLAPIDAAVLENSDFGAYLQASMRDGLAPGVEGWWEDNCLLRPWGFSLADIAVPFLLLHGRQDTFVPFAHGEWLAARIPGVEARLYDDEGHLSLGAHHLAEVHAWLSDRL
jgi:pimeloyl-ACP methyl ester carboxylesterase